MLKTMSPLILCCYAFNAQADVNDYDPELVANCPILIEKELITVANPFPYPEITNFAYSYFEITGEITLEMVNPITTTLLLNPDLRVSYGSIFSIQSHGGDTSAGLGFHGAINQMPQNHKTISIVNGAASSIASVMAFSADEVYASKNSTFLIHGSWSEYDGGYNQQDLEKFLHQSKHYNSQIKDAYMTSRPNVNEQCLDYLFNNGDNILNAEMAAKIGFIDYVILDTNSAYTLKPNIQTHKP